MVVSLYFRIAAKYFHYQTVGPTEILWMHFDGQAARFYYQQIIAKRGPIFALERDEKALHPLKTSYNIFRSGTYLSETMLAKYVTDILTWFVDAPVGQGDIDRSGHDIQMVMDIYCQSAACHYDWSR
ncbi:hypothetical protein [Bifidobacterium asteroides]|nr:hypothetical protein [Bifidobacterium asteroides]